ncbi:MAG: hypothetical protein KZQ92_01880 [Candidatus Thiodiazotropha sp. (ex Lucinoma borealis)]|nr:hypothetical protein [Candidatus Thiodiazotropha sp. (ex Lucinoma borealis)]MCU7862707.1 hypothetical protein [Candidatus Thiodiazotropha sp. (ex Lucinoma borealis)]
MSGFVVKINDKELSTVSVENLNILSVRIHGDVIGEELAELQIFGGNYESKETDTHLIWINEYEIRTNDVIEVTFIEAATTSYPGKTIDEFHSETEEMMGPWLPDEKMFEYLSKQPKLRENFSFELVSSSGDTMYASTNNNDYSFSFSVMWKWMHPEKASVWLTSNSLEGIEKKENGTQQAKFNLLLKQSVKLCIGT